MDEIKKNIISHCLKLKEEGLTSGTSGNISFKKNNKIFVTPSGVDYKKLNIEDIVTVDLDGKVIEGNQKPTSELKFHLDLYKFRKDINCIIHSHCVNATTVACLGHELPAVHYTLAFCGNKVPLAKYETYGTKELSNSIINVIGNYNGVLLENHGVIAIGTSLERTFSTLEEIEFAAKIYLKALPIGGAKILSDTEMERVKEKFKSYGVGVES